MYWLVLSVVLLIAVAALVASGRFLRETFVAGVDVLTTNPLQFSGTVSNLRSFGYDMEHWDTIAELIKSKNVQEKLSSSKSKSILADPYDASHVWKVYPKVLDGPKGYFVALVDVAKAIQLDCSYNFVGKRIGVIDRPDELFVKAIVKGFRLPPEKVHIEQVAVERWGRLEEELKRLDVIVCYLVPGSPFHKLLQSQELSVMGFGKLNADRIRLFYPYVTMEDVTLKTVLLDTPGSALRIMDRENTTSLPSMKMAFLKIVDIQEGFVTRLEFSEDAFDPSFRCFGDLSIEQKELCESKYDVMGNPKLLRTVWDRPCQKNEDCPFFKANKNYNNSRGGCDKDGFCEFPVGVKRVAYTQYDDKGPFAPFCYQCSDPDDPKCCEKQKGSWALVSPDYAFANDTRARKKAGFKINTVDTL